MGKKKTSKNSKITQANAERDADIANYSLSNRYIQVKGNKKNAQPFHVDEEDDEVDTFHKQQDRIDLNGEDDDDNDDDDNEFEERRPTLELGKQFEQEDDDEDEEEDEDEEDYAPIPLRDSDDETESKQPTDISKAWGKNKKIYYDADTVDFEIESDEDVAKAEEEEVKRMDKEKSAKLNEEDFDVSTLEDLISNKNKKKSTAVDVKKNNKNKNKKQTSSNDGLRDLELDTLENGTIEVERVTKDVSDLTQKDKLELLMSDSPELLGLLSELKSKLHELRHHIAPLITRIRSSSLTTTHGISLLEIKFHLLLNYVINVTFYLMLKSDGQQVQHHPVIKQLVHLRTMMEKIKPIDNKLKYQIDKLIKQANTTTSTDTSSSSSDPLSYKPNPDQLVAKSGGQQHDIDGDNEMDGIDTGDGIYRPPKMTAAHFDENEKAAKKRRQLEEKKRNKATSSGLIQHLRDELLSERPQTLHMYGESTKMEDHSEKDKREYEEMNMLRLMETKAEKSQRKRKERVSAMEDFEDFGDYDQLIEDTRRQQQQDDEQLGLMKKKARTEKVNEILNKVKTGMSALGGKRKQPTMEDFSDEDDIEAGQQAYAAASHASRDKRASRAAAHPTPSIRYRAEDPNTVASGSKRAIDTTIQRNRGLTRARPKDTKTPRTANREKYRKAVIRRKGQVQEFKGVQEGLNYQGEKTGIKTNVTKSVKIR